MAPEPWCIVLQEENVAQEFVRDPSVGKQAIDDRQKNEGVEGRINLERSPCPEPLYGDAAAVFILAEQEAGNQEAA